MNRASFKLATWLIAAIYLLEGVLAGAAHFHGHAHGTSSDVAAHHQSHDEHACPHGHHHHAPPAVADEGEQVPASPHHHDDCAACRYSSLQAQPITIAALPE